MRKKVEPLSAREVAAFWEMGVPLEGAYLPAEELARAVAEGRVLEAVADSSMGTAETYWRVVEAGNRWEVSEVVAYPPGARAEGTPFEERADDRDVVGVLWEPFWEEQARAAGRRLAEEKRLRVMAVMSRVAEAIKGWGRVKAGAGESLVAGLLAGLPESADHIEPAAEEGAKRAGRLDGVILGYVMERAGRANIREDELRELRLGLLRWVVRVGAGAPSDGLGKGRWRGIEACGRCARLPGVVEVDYEKDEKMPGEARELDVVMKEHEDESREAWREWSVLRCPACGTMYWATRAKDEGHSFMDPTEDSEELRRLTPHVALSTLEAYAEKDAGARAALAELKARLMAVVEGLTRMVMEGRAPNWHVRSYAIEGTIHGALAEGNEERVLKGLITHEDAGVRVEAWEALLMLANEYRTQVGYQELKQKLEVGAKAFVAMEWPMGALEGILREAPAETYNASTPGYRYFKSTTHQKGMSLLWPAARLGIRVPESLVGRVSEFLPSDESNLRWAAISALTLILTDGCTPERAARIKAYVARMSEEGKKEYTLPNLVHRLEKASTGGGGG